MTPWRIRLGYLAAAVLTALVAGPHALTLARMVWRVVNYLSRAS